MSGVNVQSSYSAGSSVDYGLYGDSGQLKERHLERGTTRAAAVSGTVADPDEFIARCEVHGRKVQVQSYTQNFSPDEFDKDNPEHVARVNELGKKLAEEMHSADYLVVTHADAKGGHLHNHIYVNNHDYLTGGSLQRYTSWSHGLWQLNDDLMRREGCWVQQSPMEAKRDWTQQREQYAAGGFEQRLGDRIEATLNDPRSVDFESYKALLAEHKVNVAVAKSGEYRYKMRHPETNKLMSKSGAKLSPDFTAAEAAVAFTRNTQAEEQEHSHGTSRRTAAGVGREASTAENTPAAGEDDRGVARRAAGQPTAGEAAPPDIGGSGQGSSAGRGGQETTLRTGAEVVEGSAPLQHDRGSDTDRPGVGAIPPDGVTQPAATPEVTPAATEPQEGNQAPKRRVIKRVIKKPAQKPVAYDPVEAAGPQPAAVIFGLAEGRTGRTVTVNGREEDETYVDVLHARAERRARREGLSPAKAFAAELDRPAQSGRTPRQIGQDRYDRRPERRKGAEDQKPYGEFLARFQKRIEAAQSAVRRQSASHSQRRDYGMGM